MVSCPLAASLANCSTGPEDSLTDIVVMLAASSLMVLRFVIRGAKIRVSRPINCSRSQSNRKSRATCLVSKSWSGIYCGGGNGLEKRNVFDARGKFGDGFPPPAIEIESISMKEMIFGFRQNEWVPKIIFFQKG